MPNEEYNEGWADCVKHYAETHISLDEFSKHLDKFFDKINTLKLVINWFHNHHNDLDIQGLPMKDSEVREQNLAFIMKAVENLKTIERKKTHVKRSPKKSGN